MPLPELTWLMTTQELAEYLNLKKNTLEKWRSFGKGPKYLKLNGVIYYEKADIVEWLKKFKVDPDADKQDSELESGDSQEGP